MTAGLALPEYLASVFVLFCRIGGCLMIIPGLSSARIAMRVRLLLALGVTIALAPIVLPAVSKLVSPDQAPTSLALLIGSELLIGAVIGLGGRFLILGLQFAVTSIVMLIGMANMPGLPVDDTDAAPSLVSFVSISAITLMFITDQHLAVLVSLAESYQALPPAEGFSATLALVPITNQVTAASWLAVRLAAPFLIYSAVVNLAVGLINKLTPQIPVYFVALPAVLLGGLAILYFLSSEILSIFNDQFALWLKNG